MHACKIATWCQSDCNWCFLAHADPSVTGHTVYVLQGEKLTLSDTDRHSYHGVWISQGESTSQWSQPPQFLSISQSCSSEIRRSAGRRRHHRRLALASSRPHVAVVGTALTSCFSVCACMLGTEHHVRPPHRAKWNTGGGINDEKEEEKKTLQMIKCGLKINTWALLEMLVS